MSKTLIPSGLMRLLSENDSSVHQLSPVDLDDDDDDRYQCWCCHLCDSGPSKHHQKVTPSNKKLAVDVTLGIREAECNGVQFIDTDTINGTNILSSDLWESSGVALSLDVDPLSGLRHDEHIDNMSMVSNHFVM